MDIETVLVALGRMLREHYGVSEGEDVRNYAALWDALLTTLEHNATDTNFREHLDEYIAKG